MSTRPSLVFRDAGRLLKEQRHRIAFFSMVLLVGIIGFEAGVLRGSAGVMAPLIIEKPSAELVTACVPSSGTVAGASSEVTAAAVADRKVPGTEGCRFIGSRNSDLFHLPTCAPAKRIKPENVVCFADERDAAARGYRPGCLK